MKELKTIDVLDALTVTEGRVDNAALTILGIRKTYVATRICGLDVERLEEQMAEATQRWEGATRGSTINRAALTELCALSSLLLAVDEADRGSATVAAEHSRFLDRVIARTEAEAEEPTK